MSEFEVSVSIPLDSDGFLRRECPHCEGQFKWHDGPANEEAENAPAAATYYCPLCGQPATPDSWWTRDQLAYAEGMAAPVAMEAVAEELDRAFKDLKGGFISFERGKGVSPETPMPLTEIDDMEIVVSPCHAYEPIKVA